MKLFLAPHNDDESLFGAFTLLREKPLVLMITDSWVQYNRGDVVNGERVTAERRWAETVRAVDVLGCAVARLGIRDDELNEADLIVALRRFSGFERVFSPALQGGHPHHDIVARAALKVFPQETVRYSTYGPDNYFINTGMTRIDGTLVEHALKARALQEYRSQLPRAGRHFDAVKNQPEWLS